MRCLELRHIEKFVLVVVMLFSRNILEKDSVPMMAICRPEALLPVPASMSRCYYRAGGDLAQKYTSYY
jgi:hypothetical protein